MNTIKNIQKQKEQIKKLEQEIEQIKTNIDTMFGEEMIKEFGIEYGDLSSKKMIKDTVKKIKEKLPENISNILNKEEIHNNQESLHTSYQSNSHSFTDSDRTS